MNTSVLYLLLAFVCIYAILSQVVDGGGQFVTKSLIKVMPNAEDSGWW